MLQANADPVILPIKAAFKQCPFPLVRILTYVERILLKRIRINSRGRFERTTKSIPIIFTSGSARRASSALPRFILLFQQHQALFNINHSNMYRRNLVRSQEVLFYEPKYMYITANI